MKRDTLRRHWEIAVLLAVAMLCAVSIPALDHQTRSGATVPRTTIAGMRAIDVEDSVLAMDPGARSSPFISSGRRSVTYTVGHLDGSITVDSLVADGAVTRVQCGAYSTPAVALSAATNPVLRFCGTLPVPGPAADTVAWIDRQFAGAAVGYSKLQDHNGLTYDLMYSQYDNDRTHYDVTVQPR
jgi:hypothetical protein